MSQPFLGSITMFGGNFAPRGYAFCAGQILSIAQNSALFALLGTTYGGNGQTTFALPDLRGRAPLHEGNSSFGNFALGQVLGSQSVTLTANQLPAHTHTLGANSGPGSGIGPANAVWARSPAASNYAASPNIGMNPAAVSGAGGSQPHNNLSPFLAINFIIALQGIFPSRN
jgi:microcystin-dependent protein